VHHDSARLGQHAMTARTRIGIGLVVVVLAMLSLTLLAAPAHAHNELLRATPADGSSLTKLPAQGRLEFAETVRPADLTVEVDGKRLPVAAAPGDAHALTFDLTGVKPSRTTVVSWTVVDSHDGHRSGGTLRLHLKGAASKRVDAPAPAADDAEPRALGVLSFGSHLVGYLAMAVLVGGLLFLALLWPAGARVRRTRVILVGTVLSGALASIGSAVVVLWRASDQTAAEALATDYGRAATALVLLWLLAAVVVAAVLQLDDHSLQGVAWRVGALVVAGGIIRVAGINAHATQGSDATLGIAADFLHLTAVSAWVGGLVILSVCLLPRGDLDELETVVPKFSRVALVSVLMIVTSGLLLLWDVSRGIDGFWSTHYARVLIVKLGLFSVVMLAAMKSKRWVETALAAAAHRRPGVRSFAMSVAAETTLVVAVLGAASVLVTSSPGV